MTRTKAEYRSSIRSRNTIKSTLIALLREKSLMDISVMELVKAADINRGTFYSHYPDVQSVLRQIASDRMEELSILLSGYSEGGVKGNEKAFVSDLFSFFTRDRENYYILFCADGGSCFSLELCNTLYSFFHERGIKAAPFLASALSGAVASYIMKDGHYSDEDLEDTLPELVSRVL